MSKVRTFMQLDGPVVFVATLTTVTAFNYETGEELKTYSTNTALIAAIVVKNERLWTAAEDGLIRVFNVKSGREEAVYKKTHSQFISCIVISDDGAYLFSSGFDGKVVQYSTFDGSIVHEFTDVDAALTTCEIHDNRLYAGSYSLETICWDIKSKKLLWRTKTPKEGRGNSPVTAVEEYKDSKICYFASETGVVSVNIEDGSILHVFEGGEEGDEEVSVRHFRITDKFILTGCIDGRARVYDRVKGNYLFSLAHTESVAKESVLSITVVDDRAFTTGTDKNVCVFDLNANGKKLETFPSDHTEWVFASFYDEKRKVLITNERNEMSRVARVLAFDINTYQHVRTFDGAVNKDVVSFDIIDEYVYVAYFADPTPVCLSLSSGLEVKKLEGHTKPVLVVYSFRDSLFTAGDDAEIRLWANNEEVLVYTGGHTGTRGIWSLLRHPSPSTHQWLFSGSSDGTIVIWDWKTGDQIRTLDHNKGAGCRVSALEFHDGVLYSATDCVTAWNPETGDKIGSFGEGEKSETIDTLVGTTLGKEFRIYTCKVAGAFGFDSGQTTVEGWTISCDKEAAKISAKSVSQYHDHQGQIYDAEISNGLLYTGSHDKTVVVRRLSDDSLVRVLKEHTGEVRCMRIRDNIIYSASAGFVTYNTAAMASYGVNQSHKLWREDGIDRFVSSYGPYADYAFLGVLLLVDFLQLLSFAFIRPEEWGESASSMIVLLEWLRSLGLNFISFEFTLYVAFAAVLLFIFSFLVQESLEWRKFLSPHTASLKYAWLFVSNSSKVISRPMFLPIFEIVMESIHCEGGVLVRVPESECFGPTHLRYIAIAVINGLFYIPLCFRFLRVGSDLSAIEAKKNPFDWSQDKFYPANSHPLSFSSKAGAFLVLRALFKMTLTVVTVFFGQVRIVNGIFVFAALGVIAASFYFPPFNSKGGNRARSALDFGIQWSYLASFLTIWLDSGIVFFVWLAGLAVAVLVGYQFQRLNDKGALCCRPGPGNEKDAVSTKSDAGEDESKNLV